MTTNSRGAIDNTRMASTTRKGMQSTFSEKMTLAGACHSENQGSCPSAVSVKRSRSVKDIRSYAWKRHAGGYIDTASFYFSDNTSEDVARHEDTIRERLGHCQHTWISETKGPLFHWRGIGCGNREVCPVCGAYVQTQYANEAVASILALQDGIEIGQGIKLECFGFKLVLTVAKKLSADLNRLLLVSIRDWKAGVDKLFELARKFIRRWFGKGAGGVISLQFAGESAPCDPHYHLHCYILPAVLNEGVWTAIPHWIDDKKLEDMRASWCSMLNDSFGLTEKKGVLKSGYLGTRGKLNHNIHYLYRHPLADLWAGWNGVQDAEVSYKYDHHRKEKLLSPDDLATLAARMQAIPKHFKRIRWFGIMSDGVRGVTMRNVGLEAVEKKGDDDEMTTKKEKWEKTGETARFVRYVPEGIILRKVLLADDGTVLRERVEDVDGWPVWRERLGDEFLIPDSQIDYRPSGVNLGKRKRWRCPGS